METYYTERASEWFHRMVEVEAINNEIFLNQGFSSYSEQLNFEAMVHVSDKYSAELFNAFGYLFWSSYST